MPDKQNGRWPKCGKLLKKLTMVYAIHQVFCRYNVGIIKLGLDKRCCLLRALQRTCQDEFDGGVGLPQVLTSSNSLKFSEICQRAFEILKAGIICCVAVSKEIDIHNRITGTLDAVRENDSRAASLFFDQIILLDFCIQRF
jgi:hypothetical protein